MPIRSSTFFDLEDALVGFFDELAAELGAAELGAAELDAGVLLLLSGLLEEAFELLDPPASELEPAFEELALDELPFDCLLDALSPLLLLELVPLFLLLELALEADEPP